MGLAGLVAGRRRGVERQRPEPEVRFLMRWQQADHGDSRPNRSLADLVAPGETGSSITSGRSQSRCTAPTSSRRASRPSFDDYRAIMVKALRRPARGGVRRMARRARREWYAPGEHLVGDDLIEERYRGIRPAFGYPACPDHSEKQRLMALLDAEQVGIEPRRAARRFPRRASPVCCSVTRRRGTSRSAGSRARPGRGLRGTQGQGRPWERPSAG